MKIKNIGVDLLKEAKRNPNVMDDQKREMLKEVLSKKTRQPLLVRPISEGFEIVDGHHRYYAAKDLGMKSVPCVVEDMTDAEAAAASLSMNRLRGEIDLGMASEMLTELKDEGWSVDDMVLTGFTAEEIDALVIDTDKTIDDYVPPSPPEAPVRPYLLELTFATKNQLTAAKKGLKHAAGKGSDMAVGLLNLLGEE